MRERNRNKGSYYEQVAAVFLEKHGYRIKVKNYRCRLGEIDIIAADDAFLCFVEVKYRKDISQGYPSEAVDWRKQRRIRQTAEYYRMVFGIEEDMPCRFDVVEIIGTNIRIIKNAF